MDTRDFVMDALGRMSVRMRDAVEGLSIGELCYRPDADANSIAWLAWHTTRVQDHHMAGMASREQAWAEDGWCERFGMELDVEDHGFGHTPEQVAALVPPDARSLADYQAAVWERTENYLATLSNDDLERIVDRSWDPPVTAGVRLVSIVNETAQHVGQMSYLRGLIDRAR